MKDNSPTRLTKEELEMEAWRVAQIALIEDVLPEADRAREIAWINQRVMWWKRTHPGLVKDEVVF